MGTATLGVNGVFAASAQVASGLGALWMVCIEEIEGQFPKIVAATSYMEWFDLTVTAWFEVDEEERIFLRYDHEYKLWDPASQGFEQPLELQVMLAEQAISQALYPVEGWR